MKTIKKLIDEFLKKEDINPLWFNNQKYKRGFGTHFVKRALKFGADKTKEDVLGLIDEIDPRGYSKSFKELKAKIEGFDWKACPDHESK